MRMILLACGVMLGPLTMNVSAQQSADAKIEVQHPWARASTGQTGAAYFIVVNRGTAPDRLMAIKTPTANKAELHEDKMKNGVMEMRPVGPLVIDAGQSAMLKPGADHVMLIGLKHPLKEGDSFPLTLSFEKAGDVQVMVDVKRAGAMGADAMGSMPHMQGGMGMDHGTMK
jgi:copper(I)-binding protein